VAAGRLQKSRPERLIPGNDILPLPEFRHGDPLASPA
jgi:hypothetical protein